MAILFWHVQALYAIVMSLSPQLQLPAGLPRVHAIMDLTYARAKLMKQLSYEIRDRNVLEVMGKIPRELFVPSASKHLAYENIPLPIDMGQTISQPYIVALMTEALELTGEQKVLEVGAGSGYQTAILCELASHVVSVERHQTLLDKARQRLERLGYTNVELHVAEETLGWERGAPYDRIIVTAGAPNVPPDLVEQLAIGGRMVIPVGGPFDQDLLRVAKRPDGITTSNLGGCSFVPLIGENAWSSD